jgi:hypothetical protein
MWSDMQKDNAEVNESRLGCRGKVAWELIGEFTHQELRGDE